MILLAVAMFAALSFAITQSSRGSGGVEREETLLSTSQAIQNIQLLRNAIIRMQLFTDITDIEFCDGASNSCGLFEDPFCTSGTDCLFANEGGDISPPAESIFAPLRADNTTTFIIVKTASMFAVNMDGIGTAATDIVMMTQNAGITEEACRIFNQNLGLGSSIATNTNDNTDGIVQGYSGKPIVCVRHTDGTYQLYATLIEN